MVRLLFMVFACLVIATPVAAKPSAFTLEDIARLQSVSAVRMSPAGDRIAYLRSVPRELYKDDDGKAYRELHVVDLKGQSQPYVTGDIRISDFAWSADAQAIFFLAKRDKDADFNALHRIALAGGEAEEIFSHVNSIGHIYPAPDGQTLAFTATYAPPEKHDELKKKGFKAEVYEESVLTTKLWLLDLDSGEAKAQTLPGSVLSFRWSNSGNQYAVALAPTALVDDAMTAADIYVVNRKHSKVKARLGSVGKLGGFAFSPDDSQIAYIGSEDANDPSSGRLYLVPAQGGERRDLLPGYPGHVRRFAWRDNGEIAWLGHRGLWSEWQNLNLNDDTQAKLPALSGPILRTVHAAPGQAAVAAIANSPEHPSEVYVLEAGAEPRRLTDSNPWLAERRFAPQETVRYTARDGLELDAIVIRPQKKKRRGYPLVVFAHGGPESHFSNGWLTGYSRPGQVLANEGYVVVYPNYRGSTGRGVAFSKMGQKDYAAAEFDDLVDAKRHLVNQGWVNADKVGITGGSYGGYASMWSASALSEEYAAAVAFVGISNQLSKFGTGDIPVEMYNVHARTWPWEDWMWMLKRSPIYHADKTKTPLLIMHGDSDPRVHPSQSLEMYRYVKLRTDTPVRLVFYPGEGHGNRKAAAQYDYSLRLKRWMDHYLKGPGGEAPPYELDHARRLEASKD